MLNNEIFIILVLYVDNMLIASESMTINLLKDHMARAFDMKDLGEKKNKSWALRYTKIKTNGNLWLSQ
jgi:hypothetical protein